MSGGKIREYQYNAQGGVSSINFITTPTGGGGGAWGSITGTLSDQSDLQTQLNTISSKQAITSLSSAAYTLATNYATSAQGGKADSAVQPGTLSSAAYTLSTQYAVSTHFHSASDVTTSTFALARLGGGTTNVSTFLNGTGAFSQPVYTSLSGLPVIPVAMSTVKVTSLKNTTTTSSLSIPELAFALVSSSSYAFNFNVLFATKISSTGLKVSLLTPSISTFGATARIPNGAGSVNGEMEGFITGSGVTVTATSSPLASTQYVCEIVGTITPSAAGTLQLTYGTSVAGSAVSTFVGGYGTLITL